MPRPTRWKGCVNGLKGRVRACFICPPIRLTSTPSKWPAPKLSSSCARLKRALWKHSMRRLLRPYKLFLRAMLKASSSMSDSVYDPYGNRYKTASPLASDGDRLATVPRWSAHRPSCLPARAPCSSDHPHATRPLRSGDNLPNVPPSSVADEPGQLHRGR